MNVIKFKDTWGPDGKFNDLLRGKYAYWIGMRYAVPFACATLQDYIKLEREPKLIDKYPHWDTNKGSINILIDVEETDRVNSIKSFEAQNEYVAEDITTAELKNFRTWLAKELLKLNLVEGDEKMMLEYYASGMYNDIVRILSKVDSEMVVPTTINSGCDRCSSTQSHATSLNTCDPLSAYRAFMYGIMVKMFSEVEFWKEQYTVFLQQMLIYLKGILKVGFTIKSVDSSKFVDCSCTGDDSDREFRDIITRLCTSIEYVLDADTTGHKLFMAKAFNDFAALCYEQMQWTN